MRLVEIAELVGGELRGDGNLQVGGLNSLEQAGPDEITFLVKAKEGSRLSASRAAAALVPQNFTESVAMPIILVRDPYLASAIVHNRMLTQPFAAKGVHPRAWVGADCQIAGEVTIEPLAVIGNRVRIGERVVIGAGAVVGDETVIGDDVVIKPNVTIAERCQLGSRVIIHSGTVIGSDGYGYATDPRGFHVKRPQVGRVRIDDDVEIGANVCVDRGAFGDTWIQSGVKIDNLVQVAHNVVIGPNSLIVAQVGLAGSCTLGRNVVLGGKVAVNGHIHLDDMVMVAAGSGIHGSLPKGAKVGGVPAIEIKTWAKCTAVYARLPEMHSELRRLKKAVAELELQLGQTPTTGEQHD